METKTENPEASQSALRDPDSAASAPSEDVSLIRGGLFYRVQRATHLIGGNRWNLGRRVLFAVAIGWVPLVVLTAALNPSALRSLLTDYRVTARMLIAVPVLLAGQVLMESRFRMIMKQLRESRILRPPALQRLEDITANLIRWRDSIWPELVLIAIVYVNVSFAVSARVHEPRPWAIAGESITQLLPAGWYYIIVSQLVYQYLAAILLWKWLLWSLFTFRLSRLDMELIPTHPDKNGGLGFLGLSPAGFVPIAFAATAAIGANWREEILAGRAHLTDFKMEAIVLTVILLLIAVGPLAFFTPRLAKVRRRGLLDYGTLGQIHSADFHRKWILDPNRNDEEFLAAPEVSTLTDYGTSYGTIEQMKPFPIDKGSLIGLAVGIVLPLMPVVVAEIPIAVVLKALFNAVK
jgi:hypothetical protein